MSDRFKLRIGDAILDTLQTDEDIRAEAKKHIASYIKATALVAAQKKWAGVLKAHRKSGAQFAAGSQNKFLQDASSREPSEAEKAKAEEFLFNYIKQLRDAR